MVAGVSVALVAIPQSLAYAELAGLPARHGLYASALPSLVAALFVSSKYLQTGPVAMTALLTFGALSPLAAAQSAEYVALAALLALMVGALRVLLGVVRLGRVAYLLTPPVLVGFTTAAAVLILSSQLPKALGVDPGRGGVLVEAVHALSHPADWNRAAIAFAALTLALVIGGRRLHPLFPGVLLAVVLGVGVSSVADFGGAVVGELDGGFVSFDLGFEWSAATTLLVPAMVIALVGFAEPASIARTFAEADGDRWDADREMVSQGFANLAAAVSGAFPVGGSFSRSSLNRLAGATSPWAGAVTGAFVLLALPFTPALRDLPEAVLGAVVIAAVLKLVDVRGIWKLIDVSWMQFAIGIVTMAATLASAPRIERGVLIGIVMSLLVSKLERRATQDRALG